MAGSDRNNIVIACFALLVSISALQVPSCIIDDERGTSTSTSTSAGTTTAAAVTASASAPPPLFDDGALMKAAMLALAGMDALVIAAAVIYSRHTHHAAVGAGGGGGNWRVSELAFFVLCLQVGVLQFVLFVQEPTAAARELGASAARALPCVAFLTFFLGITLIYAHVDVGNGGGAAGGAVAGDGPVPAPATATVRLLPDMTLGAALACLMSIILALFYIKTK